MCIKHSSERKEHYLLRYVFCVREEIRRQNFTCKLISSYRKHFFFLPLKVNVQFLEGKLHAISFRSIIFLPSDWHLDIEGKKRERITRLHSLEV